MNDQSFGQLPVAAFLDRLASADPAPGGGSAAALAGAIAAALVAMTCNLTVGREQFAAVEAEARAVLAEAEELRRRLTTAIDADATAYAAVAAALKLPRATPEERAARSARLQEALAGAARVPLAAAADCAAVLALAERAARVVNPNVLSDVVVAVHLARAALLAAAANVEVNLPALRDEALRAELATRLAALTGRLEGQAAAVLAAVVERRGQR